MFVLSPMFTSLTNSYELQTGARSLPGFYPLDAVKSSLNNLITLAPFFIGMRFLSADGARASLLKSLPIAILFYSVPMLFEVRMSPQLHAWVYGFFPHDFGQQIRDGGFRPVVFLHHGIEVAFITSLAVIAAAVAMRARWHVLRMPAGVATAYLAVVLLLCKTLGAAIYAFVFVPVVLFTKPKTWVRIACVIALLICAYPLLRTYDIVPVHRITTAANSISADRSSSFGWRVKNEDMLLEKANQKPLLGWGTWSRNRVFDQESGRDISVTDGVWIIQFGVWGWMGYLSMFGLFASSLFRARQAVRGPVSSSSIVTGGMSLLLAVNLVDLVPNADLLPLTFLMAGTIAGCVARYPGKHVRKEMSSAPAAWLAA